MNVILIMIIIMKLRMKNVYTSMKLYGLIMVDALDVVQMIGKMGK